MSTYSMSVLESELQEPILAPVDVESIVKDEDIEAAYEESAIDAAHRAVFESTVNLNSILKACAITEFCYLEENGTEMIYEGAKLDAFVNKAKEVFLGIWKKIQEIFKKVIMQFNAWFVDDKTFITKYEKDINKKISVVGMKDKNVNIYPYLFLKNKDAMTPIITCFSDLKANKAISGILSSTSVKADEWKEANKNVDKEFTDKLLDEVRGCAIKAAGGTDTSVTSNEYRKMLKEALQGSASKDSTALKDAIAPAITFLKDSKGIKTAMDKALKESKKAIDDSIKGIVDLKKIAEKTVNSGNATDAEVVAGQQVAIYTKFISVSKSNADILTLTVGTGLECLKACSRQSKAVCVAAIRAPKGETAAYSESGMSLLDTIKFI